MTQPINLFEQLMPSRPREVSGQPRSFGREDYVTEVVAATLRADAEAGGTLCHYLFKELFDVQLEGTPVVTTQATHEAFFPGDCCVDLMVETDRDLVFIENKTGSRLGTSVVRDTGAAVTQLVKYAEALDKCAERSGRRTHLGMLVWAQPSPPETIKHWRGFGFWWDLHRAMSEAPAARDPFAARLRSECLDFFARIQLDPPCALRVESVEDAPLVQRLLAMALSRASSLDMGADVRNPRPAGGGSYVFDLARANGGLRKWSLAIVDGELNAHASHEGYAGVSLLPSFMTDDVQGQVAQLASVVVDLQEAVAVRRGAIGLEELLTGMGAHRGTVESLLQAAEVDGWDLRVSSRSATLEKEPGTFIFVTARTALGPRVRVQTSVPAGRERVREAILGSLIGARVREEGSSVMLQLADTDQVKIRDLPRAVGAALAATSADASTDVRDTSL